MTIELRPFSEHDIPRLIGWVPSEEFLLLWGGPSWTYPLTPDQLLRHLAGAGDTAILFSAVAVGSGAHIGHGELINIDRRNGSARISRILVGPDEYRGRGAGLAIVHGLLAHAFEKLHLHRVELVVFDFNEAAIRCYEKAGFSHEGIMRECRRSGNTYWSLCMMSILRHEWRQGSERQS